MNEKLVRDLIPQNIAAKGEPVPPTRKVTGDEKLRFLLLKLVEEAKEALAAESEEALVEELADVETVWQSIINVKDGDMLSGPFLARISNAMGKKGGSNGFFEEGIVMQMPPEQREAEPCEHGCKGWCKDCFIKVRDEALKADMPDIVKTHPCVMCKAPAGEWCREDCTSETPARPYNVEAPK